MDEDTKRKRLDELWEAVLPGATKLDEEEHKPRSFACIRAILKARADHRISRTAGDLLGTLEAIGRGRILWQLLSLEVAYWLPDDGLPPHFSEKSDWWHSRPALASALDNYIESGGPLHRQAIDPTPLLIPRWLLIELQSALAALDEGEVQDLVKPASGGRHGDAWTWDQMRAGALEHVAFLHGQGVAKQMARRRVANHTGITENALRDWERSEQLKSGFDRAFEAGKLKIVLEDNPKYAEGDGNTVSGEAFARLNRFKTDPSLVEFGKQYKERFGHRHNPGTTAAD